MPRTSLAYRALLRLGTALVPLAGRRSPKAAEGHRARRGVLERFADWARAARDPSRLLLWCHAPSVGEGLQARSVLALLRKRHPDWQIGYTFFSPSAAALAHRQPADFADYLPYDTATNVEGALDALRPTALVFTKLDLWPELAVRAAVRGVRVGLIAATVSPVSGRLRWPAWLLTRAGYQVLDRVGAVSQPDAERLIRLGVRKERITIAGDPRFDSALAVARSVGPDDPLLQLGAGGPTLVAGSTWPADEAVVLRAFAAVRREEPNARLILVPHEPTEEHLGALDRVIAELGLPAGVRLSAADGPVPLLLVDRVGLLATLYRAGTMAFVGGGFGRAGLHSVLEPAACGLPVVFGPRWQQSREAALLLEAGAATALDATDPEAAAGTLARRWEAWLQDQRTRAAWGAAARRVVEAGLGAAERNAEVVETLMT